MAYTQFNFATKKAMREAVEGGVAVPVYQPGPFGPDVPDGEATIEGPHYPKAHLWHARVQVKDGRIVKVLS